MQFRTNRDGGDAEWVKNNHETTLPEKVQKSNESYLLTVRQAAKRLNLGINRTYGLANAGVLPCLKFGNSIRIPAAALEKWLQDNIGREF